MSSVSISRVVDVTINVNDRFPTVASFGTPLILVKDDDGDGNTTTTLTADKVKSFSTIDEVLTYGFAKDTDAYLTAAALVGVNNAPKTFKLALWDGTIDDAVKAALVQDSAFYCVVVAGQLSDTDSADLLATNQTLIANRKLLTFNVNDTALRDDGTDATGLAALLKGTSPSRMIGFYLDNPNLDADGLPDPALDNPYQQYAAKAAAYISGVDYNNPNSHYTLKFKRLDGSSNTSLTDTQVQNLTGFQPGTGLDENIGGFLNTYICMAGQNFVVEGIATDGTFVDQLTFVDWLYATMQSNVLGVFINAKVIPYDATGVSLVLSAITQTLDTAVASGALTDARPDVDGELLPAYEVSAQDFTEVSAALQAQRIAPAFEYCARYAGAFHFADIIGTLKLAN